MSEQETFLARWARLKREAEDAVAPASPVSVPSAPSAGAGAAQATQPLPPLESLDFASDFTAFLQNEVEESVKRTALKKLFHSPEFNVMDGLDVYIDDYGVPDPIPPEMLRRLAHAKDMLFGTAQERDDAAAQKPTVADGVSTAAAEPRSPDEEPDP
jgi:hypothetical protein